MSNPEKRDERSMSDILASIRKIMAQEPTAAPPPNPARGALNGVSISREPELKLPPHLANAEGSAAAPLSGTEPVSLDELLAETPHAGASPSPANRAASPSKVAPASAPGAQAGMPEWLFPRSSQPVSAKESAAAAPQRPAPVHVGEAPPAPPADGAPEAAPPSRAAKPDAPPAVPKEAAKPADGDSPVVAIGPPPPKLGDLGSVVPGKLESPGPAPSLGAPPSRPATNDRPVLAPPHAGPLLGEPARASAASEPLPEVPGADALRRLIAGVIPPSAHPSVAPSAKAAEPVPATGRADAAHNPDASPKSARVVGAEAERAPADEPQTSGKQADPAPALSPPAKPAAAAPIQASKPAASAAAVPAARVEGAVPSAAAPVARPAVAAASAGGKSMDETVVELLRPLLREWLNANMPRLIEPALKAEIEALRNAVAKAKDDKT